MISFDSKNTMAFIICVQNMVINVCDRGCGLEFEYLW